MFLVNSRLGRFAAAPAGSPGSPVHPQGHPFSRSYGVNMPSSLTMVLPIASVYSTRPPVSVLVRAPTFLPRGFSRKHGLAGFAIRLVSRLGLVRLADLHASRPTRFHGDVQNPARLPFSVAPSVIAARRRYGNVDPLRIGYALRPRLSSRLTLGGLASPRKPWTFGGGVSRPPLVTHASIRTPGRSTVGCPPASLRTGRSPTADIYQPAASVPCLAP